MEAKKKVFNLIQGFWGSQCLYIATRLGIPNILQDEGEQSVEYLARKTGTHTDTLYVILRALGHLEVLEEKPGRVFAPTAASELLVTHRGASMGHFAMHITEPAQWDGWKELYNATFTGEVAFERANGKSVYEFTRDEPWSGDVFIKAMTFLTDHATDSLLDVYDFSPFKTILDVGGGRGGNLAKIVQRYGCKGMLFDMPYVIATAPAFLASRGISPTQISLHTGDVFDEIPSGADAIVMKYFLSAWNDEDAKKIVLNCRRALPEDGKLILMQSLVPELGEPVACPDGIMPGLFAVQIRSAVPGGVWRTAKEYQTIFAACGFRLDRIVHTATNLSAMEFTKVSPETELAQVGTPTVSLAD